MSFFLEIYSLDISQLSNVYATPYFSKKVIHLLNVTGKNFDLSKPKYCLIRLEHKVRLQLKSTQKLSCKLPSRTRASIIKLGTNSI